MPAIDSTKLNQKRGGRTTHGRSDTPEYYAWSDMMTRCYNEKHKEFVNYGGRGIKVFDKWHTFAGFFEDMGLRPSPTHSIDRFPNQDGGYEPCNCRWATKKEQARNRKTNRFLTFNGETKLLVEWSELLGIPFDVIFSRIKSGKSVEESLSTPVKVKQKISREEVRSLFEEYHAGNANVSALAIKYSMNEKTVREIVHGRKRQNDVRDLYERELSR